MQRLLAVDREGARVRRLISLMERMVTRMNIKNEYSREMIGVMCRSSSKSYTWKPMDRVRSHKDSLIRDMPAVYLLP